MIEDVKRIPYGVSNFVEVVEQNQYYVDKTMYLPLLEQQPNSLFFIRPRRFGKSIFLSMLRTYYDISQKEKFQKRFGNLWIGSQPTPLQGTFQILFLDFSRIGGIDGHWHRTLTIIAAVDWMTSHPFMNHTIIRDLH